MMLTSVSASATAGRPGAGLPAVLGAAPRDPRRPAVAARLEIAVGEALLVVGDRLGAGDALGGDGERARQARGHVRLRNPPARSSRPCARPRAARGRAG